MKRTPEFVLSLIGVIFFSLVCLARAYASLYQSGTSVLPLTIAYVVGYNSVYLAMCILIWVGTFKIKSNNKRWGIFILIMGVLNTFSAFFIAGVLFLIAGIMMLARKPKNN